MSILPLYQEIPQRIILFSALCSGVIDNLEIHEVVPDEMQNNYQKIGRSVLLTDFAGRDSIAACMEILKHEQIDTVIPIGDIVPSRFGDTDSYFQNWEALSKLIKKNHSNIDLKPWFIVDGQDFWKILNERYVSQIRETYGWFTPCTGCHFHFYAMRAVLIEILKNYKTILVSGEKRLHRHGKKKANQTDAAVKAYSEFSHERGVDHRFPIHHFESEELIATLIGDEWKEGRSQMSCIHSGNDQNDNGGPRYSDEQISEVMAAYILPMGKKYLEVMMDVGNNGNILSILDSYSNELLRRG